VYNRDNHDYYDEEFKMIQIFANHNHYVLKDLVLDTVFIPEELEEILPKVLLLDDEGDIEIYEHNVIPIAYCPGSELIMLGVGEHNADLIYYFARYKEPKLERVADNVFEFFKDYYVKIDEFYLRGRRVEDLYQNWGEKFWRFKPEGDITRLIEQKNLEIKNLHSEKDKYLARLRVFARHEKNEGTSLDIISAKYGFSEEELDKSFF
jgi:hypothetical protein